MKLNMVEQRSKVMNLTTTLALQTIEKTGQDYKTTIIRSLDEACKRLDISQAELEKMFI